MTGPNIFSTLHRAQRIWAIASVHGELDRLLTIQSEIENKFIPGDRLIFLGNILGRGVHVRETVNALMTFRRLILSRHNYFTHDFVILRGAQEEMWQRLMQLQFAVNASEVLEWMLGQGINTTLNAYESSAEDAKAAIRQGPMAITHWTSKIRTAFQAAGHQEWLSSLKHAAYTKEGSILFVNRSIDPERPIDAQADVFWWGTNKFDSIKTPYSGFLKVVRGFDPAASGLVETDHTVSLDAGSGRDGPLLAVCLSKFGEVLETLEA